MAERQRRERGAIPDLRTWYPDLGFSGRSELVTANDPILITDPIYLADVYNANDDPVARWLRREGVIVCDFGGDASCPVWWEPPGRLVLPTSIHREEAAPPEGAFEVAGEIGCDSASFVLVVVSGGLDVHVRAAVEKAVSEGDAALVNVPAGAYRVFLEQFEGGPVDYQSAYRDIVAERSEH